MLLAYLGWFWYINSAKLSDEPEAWSQFGDFIGGVINPIVAYAAYYWLTRTVVLQKEELLETRKTLQDSSSSQALQAQYSRNSVRASALSALINSIMVEVQTQRMQLQFIIEQSSMHQAGSARLFDGSMLTGHKLQEHINVLNNQISMRMTERLEYEKELKSLLAGTM